MHMIDWESIPDLGLYMDQTVSFVQQQMSGWTQTETVDALLMHLGVREPWRDAIRLPRDCELAVREKGGRRFFFVLNYGWQEAEIALARPLRDVDTGEAVSGAVRLEAFGTRVYEEI